MRLHIALLLTALLGLAAGVATPAQASERYLSGYGGSYSRGGYSYGGHSGHGYKGGHGGGYYYHPTSSGSSSSPRLYHYTARGSSGSYNFNFFRKGYDSRNGYSGPNTSIDRPHRSDWETYMRRLQRQAKNQQASDTADLCGNYLRAPARCRDTTTRYDPVRYVEIRYIPEISGAYR